MQNNNHIVHIGSALIPTSPMPEELITYCPLHGAIEPVFVGKHWHRRGCQCERQQREAQEQEEQKQQLIEQRLHRCYTWLGNGWTHEYLREKTFATFDQQRQPDAYRLIQAFLNSVQGSLVIHGPYGTGKTHLLAAICDYLIRQRDMGMYFTTSTNLFAALQDRIARNDDHLVLLQRAINAPLLIIDDIDKAKPSDFRLETYYEIIDKRVQAGRPLAISTNRFDELKTFVGGAVVSRLNVGLLEVEMRGKDYRESLRRV